MAEGRRTERSGRSTILWVLSALLLSLYFASPDGDDPPIVESAASVADSPSDPKKLEIVHVSPSDPSPSSAIVLTYTGAPQGITPQAFVNKTELNVITSQPGTLVVRLPKDAPIGHLKVRIAAGNERSKPYDIRVKAINWRKAVRNLSGGFALLLFGIGMFTRGLREGLGIRTARLLGRVVRNNAAAAGVGTILGGFIQCTTAAAGVLAGLVSSRLVGIGAAAAAFIGVQAGAAVAPLLMSAILEGRGGLIVVAVGMLWVGLGNDRRTVAFGQFLLGAGLIAFGVQTMRPGFEPFVSAPALLPLIEGIRATDLAGIAQCTLLGAALVAALQGPVPVLMLVVVLAQTTGHWDLRTSLAVLSGSGLGAALSALLTTPAGPRCRRLARMHLVLGTASTLFTAATIEVWCRLVDWAFVGAPVFDWGSKMVVPNAGLKLAVAFAVSQLAAALVLLPVVGPISRLVERWWPERPVERKIDPEIAPALLRTGLLKVLGAQLRGLEALSELVLSGRRAAGRLAEHRLAATRASVEELLALPTPALPATTEGAKLGRAAFASLQLQRSLETLLLQAEPLTQSRVAALVGSADVAPITDAENTILGEMHKLLANGISDLIETLEGGGSSDLDSALAREIEMNRLEARARDALTPRLDAAQVRTHLHVLEMADAYEDTGNHLCRIAVVVHSSVLDGPSADDNVASEGSAPTEENSPSDPTDGAAA